MKPLAVFGFLLVGLMQIEARSIGMGYDETPTGLEETKKQSFLCSIELGPQKLKGLRDFSSLPQFPEDNEAFNALWGCIFKKKGIINEKAEINEEKLEDYFWKVITGFSGISPASKNAIHELAQDCKDIHGDGYGQTAAKILNCGRNLANKRGLRK